MRGKPTWLFGQLSTKKGLRRLFGCSLLSSFSSLRGELGDALGLSLSCSYFFGERGA